MIEQLLISMMQEQQQQGGGDPGEPARNTDPVVIAASSADPDRVDALSLIKLSSGRLFGSYSAWSGSEGRDEGNSVQQVVTSDDDGETYNIGPAIPPVNECSIHASYYERSNGDIIQIAAGYIALDGSQDVEVYIRTSTDGGSTFGSPVLLCGGVGERWISASNRILKLNDGTLLFPIAKRGAVDLNAREVYLFKSLDDGETWSMVEAASGVPLVIQNTGGAANYATEPGLYITKTNELICYFRTKDGWCRGTKLTRTGNYFDKSFVFNIVPAPSSTTTIRYIPGIKKFIAVHNDPGDDESGGDYNFTARKNLIYSLSDTGLPGSWTQMPNKIKAYDAGDGLLAFEPDVTPVDGGAIIAFTVYFNSFTQYCRFLTNEMLLETIGGGGGWAS